MIRKTIAFPDAVLAAIDDAVADGVAKSRSAFVIQAAMLRLDMDPEVEAVPVKKSRQKRQKRGVVAVAADDDPLGVDRDVQRVARVSCGACGHAKARHGRGRCDVHVSESAVCGCAETVDVPDSLLASGQVGGVVMASFSDTGGRA